MCVKDSSSTDGNGTDVNVNYVYLACKRLNLLVPPDLHGTDVAFVQSSGRPKVPKTNQGNIPHSITFLTLKTLRLDVKRQLFGNPRHH